MMRKGTTVEGTIIAAPPSTKNKAHERGQEMHRTKKGNEWHFDRKAHIGGDPASRLVHSLHADAANKADAAHAHAVLHGQVAGDRGGVADPSYTGVEKRGEVKDAQVKSEISKDVTCYVAAKRGSDKGLATN